MIEIKYMLASLSICLSYQSFYASLFDSQNTIKEFK